MWLETLKKGVAAAAGRFRIAKSRSEDAAISEPTIAGGPKIDTDIGSVALAEVLAHVETCWRNLGETEPHWSVLTNPQCKSDRIAETGGEFFASGEGDVRRMMKAAARCGIALPLRGTCFELGCGVGRLTLWLSRSFNRVIAADISPSHLALAEQTMKNAGSSNVDLRLVNRPEALEQLPTFDCFFSLIVLQHNPPPVIRWLLLTVLSKLNAGGVGFFQVPTRLPGYSFDAAAYMTQPPTDGLMEMHALPHEVVLATIHEAGCELLETGRHDVAHIEDAMFMEFFVRKRRRPIRWLRTKMIAKFRDVFSVGQRSGNSPGVIRRLARRRDLDDVARRPDQGRLGLFVTPPLNVFRCL